MKSMTGVELEEAFAEMRKILAEKYFYKPEFFEDRTKIITIKDESTRTPIRGLCFEVYEGAPFALFVPMESRASEETREKVFDWVLSTESLGFVAFFLVESESFEIFRKRFRDGKFETIPSFEYYYKGSGGGSPSLFNADSQSGRPSESLLPITNKLENIFFEIHSVMRDIDGLHADNALEELCKVIYLKSYLEEQKTHLPIPAIATEAFGTVEEFAACIRALYREAIDYDIRVYRLKIPEYERSRGVFDLPIYLSSTALVKSFQYLERYSLTQSDTDLKGRAFQKVLGKSIRSGMGQYFTPSPVCRLMVEIVGPSSADLILDPFCGSGHFLSESLAYVRQRLSEQTKEFHEFAFGKLHGIEKSDRMTRIAMTDMRLNGDGHSNIRCTDALLEFDNYPDIRPDSFDLVLTNPPFGSLLGAEAIATLGRFTLSAGRKKVPLELLGLERSIDFLRPGGKIAIVLPENIFNGDSTRYVREWLLQKIKLRLIIDLPNQTFAPFGANVRSGILFGRKLRPGESISSESHVCVMTLDSLGYDAAGRDTSDSDLDQAISEAKKFLVEEGW